MFVAALDLGTTGCRTFIFDLAGTVIASDYQEWQSFYPSPSFVEQNANTWWDSLKTTIEKAIKKSGIDKTDIIKTVYNLVSYLICPLYILLHLMIRT